LKCLNLWFWQEITTFISAQNLLFFGTDVLRK